MTVYVDDARIPARLGRFPARWSHLFADDTSELLAFAAELGLSPNWIQHPGSLREHFDVTDTKRREALARGAVPITWRDTVDLIRRKRAARYPAPPRDGTLAP